MNYYIQGSLDKAKEINAAFEKLGYDTTKHFFNAYSVMYFTFDGEIRATTDTLFKTFIKTRTDYNELELPIQPKFKAGDWLVYNNGNCFAGGFSEAQVVKVKDGVYFFVSGTSGSFKFIDENCRLWTIEDAKDGDVITNGKLIVIFNKLEEPTYKQHIIAYVGLDLCGRLQITEDTWQLGVDKAMPATKEQRDQFFAKMKETGYQWDADKKELRKIKPHYDISNFYAGMPVLQRSGNDEHWYYNIFSYYLNNNCSHPFILVGCHSKQCIPFEGNEHLLGTTDMCPEEYINW